MPATQQKALYWLPVVIRSCFPCSMPCATTPTTSAATCFAGTMQLMMTLDGPTFSTRLVIAQTLTMKLEVKSLLQAIYDRQDVIIIMSEWHDSSVCSYAVGYHMSV